MHTETETDTDENFIALATTEDFDAFWDENGDYLDMDRQTAFGLSCNCNLIVGGGAAPMFRVGFVD